MNEEAIQNMDSYANMLRNSLKWRKEYCKKNNIVMPEGCFDYTENELKKYESEVRTLKKWNRERKKIDVIKKRIEWMSK